MPPFATRCPDGGKAEVRDFMAIQGSRAVIPQCCTGRSAALRFHHLQSADHHRARLQSPGQSAPSPRRHDNKASHFPVAVCLAAARAGRVHRVNISRVDRTSPLTPTARTLPALFAKCNARAARGDPVRRAANPMRRLRERRARCTWAMSGHGSSVRCPLHGPTEAAGGHLKRVGRWPSLGPYSGPRASINSIPCNNRDRLIDASTAGAADGQSRAPRPPLAGRRCLESMEDETDIDSPGPHRSEPAAASSNGAGTGASKRATHESSPSAV